MILPNNLPFLFPSPTAIDNFIENDMPFLKDQQNQVANLEAVMNLREKEFIDQTNMAIPTGVLGKSPVLAKYTHLHVQFPPPH